MQPLLEWVAQSQGQWSATAGQLKTRYERARRVALVLAISGSIAAAVASQQDHETARKVLAIVGAVMLGVGGLVTGFFLGPDKAAGWVRARSASEALKRAAYQFAAQASPYDDPATRDAQLRADVGKLEAEVDDLLDRQAPAQRGSTPDDALAPPDYIARRPQQAATWYAGSADRHQATRQRWRFVELTLALVTTILTIIVGMVSKAWFERHTGFDWAVLVGVLTTLSGVVVAHIEASRYDHLVSSYRAAARKLRYELSAAPTAPVVPSTGWSAFVGRCEDVVANETGSWAARFSKPGGH